MCFLEDLDAVELSDSVPVSPDELHSPARVNPPAPICDRLDFPTSFLTKGFPGIFSDWEFLAFLFEVLGLVVIPTCYSPISLAGFVALHDIHLIPPAAAPAPTFLLSP